MIKNWGWGAIKERTKRKKIFQIRSPEMQTYKPTKKKIKKKEKKKKKKTCKTLPIHLSHKTPPQNVKLLYYPNRAS
jgi:hypothetical protein